MNIDIRSLMNHCQNPIEHYHGIGSSVIESGSDDTRFIDNGGEILGIAHLDFIDLKIPPKFDKLSQTIYSTALDDRLGVYCLLDYLPKCGLNFDILLTTDEEKCQSTAYYFETKKKYKWIFELDRMGYDIVAYQYKHKELENYLKRFGYSELGFGSYSDIADLDHLNCTGLNFGIGYYDQHTIYCHANLYFIQFCLERFINFFRLNQHKSLPHKIEDDYTWGRYASYKYLDDPYSPKNKKSKIDWDDPDNFGKLPRDLTELECIYCGLNFDPDIDDIEDFISSGDLCINCRENFYNDWEGDNRIK